MARTIAIDIPHGLGLAEAQDCAAEGIEKLAYRLPPGATVEYDWVSDHEALVDVVALGQSVGARVTVGAEKVRIALTLPLMLSLMSGPITAKVREAIESQLRERAARVPVPRPARAAPVAVGQRPVLFQYWDRPTPPADVASWIAGFRADNPRLKHILVDRERAAGFIARHQGTRHAAAFAACAHPAMQADYFRLCAMAAMGGLYLDADMQSLRPLDGLLDRAPEALIVVWKGLLNNSILLFRAPGHSFARAALELATRIIEQRLFRSVALATGPGVFNAIRYLADPAFRATMTGMLESGWEDVSALIGDASDPALARKVAGTLDRAGWEDLQTLARMADALVIDFPTLAEDYAAITLIGTADSLAWIGQEPAAYQAAGDSWVFSETDIYR